MADITEFSLAQLTGLEDLTVVEVLNQKEGEFLFLKANLRGMGSTVQIRKTTPKMNDVLNDLSSMSLENKTENKAYGGYLANFPGPAFDVDIYCPALDCDDPEKVAQQLAKKESKLRARNFVMVTETPERYRTVTEPFIASRVAHCSWVGNIMQNIMEDKAQCYDISKDRITEKVVYSDPDPENGFALLVDFKWKKHPKTMGELQPWLEANPPTEKGRTGVYCIAFPVRTDIRSLRDIRAEHLPLLKELRAEATRTMQEMYGVPEEKLRMFVHYQPQYYYFHVHVTSMDIDFGVMVGKAKLLDEIISNVEMVGDYYANATLVYSVPEDFFPAL